MTEFLAAALAFPTVVLTALLGCVAFYWAVVALGALDVDALDFDVDVDAADGGADGLGHILPLSALGLGGVPVTVSLSLFVLFAWTAAMLGHAAFGVGSLAARSLVALAALVVGLAGAALAVRPLRRAFVVSTARDRRSLVGKTCVVTTLRVDETFGQAEIRDGGAPLLVQVRYDGAPGTLARGATALVFDYDPEDEVFHVAPVDADVLAPGQQLLPHHRFEEKDRP